MYKNKLLYGITAVLTVAVIAADILRAIRLSKATVRKMKQNLAWSAA